MVVSLLLAIDCHIEKCNPPGLSLGKHFPAPQTSDRMSEFQYYIQGNFKRRRGCLLALATGAKSSWMAVLSRSKGLS